MRFITISILCCMLNGCGESSHVEKIPQIDLSSAEKLAKTSAEKQAAKSDSLTTKKRQDLQEPAPANVPKNPFVNNDESGRQPPFSTKNSADEEKSQREISAKKRLEDERLKIELEKEKAQRLSQLQAELTKLKQELYKNNCAKLDAETAVLQSRAAGNLKNIGILEKAATSAENALLLTEKKIGDVQRELGDLDPKASAKTYAVDLVKRQDSPETLRNSLRDAVMGAVAEYDAAIRTQQRLKSEFESQSLARTSIDEKMRLETSNIVRSQLIKDLGVIDENRKETYSQLKDAESSIPVLKSLIISKAERWASSKGNTREAKTTIERYLTGELKFH